MRLRGLVKKFMFEWVPYLKGRFYYYGHPVYFPRGSHIFERACAEGIYEEDVTRLVLSMVKPGTTYFDVGANIGLLSVPILSQRPEVDVVSIEASPETVLHLQRTQRGSPFRQRWTVIAAAVGAENGEAEFWSDNHTGGAYDGLRDTGSGGPKRLQRVSVRTLDQIWCSLGRPPISVIKMDIEGGEYEAMLGASDVILHSRPVLLVEWIEQLLSVYHLDKLTIFDICDRFGYMLLSIPHLCAITSSSVLSAAMAFTSNFVLIPKESGLR
jgi:FkbM family methyltransferase